MKILITGGSGFQGTHLANHLLGNGHEITILNTRSQRSANNMSTLNQSVTTVWGSVTDPEIVSKTVRENEVVFHMAARVNVDDSIEAPSAFISVNISGTNNVLQAIKEHGSRLIYASSCEVYGSGQPGPLTEESELRPYSPYAASKAAADRLCFSFFKTYNLPVTIVRPCNIFGPGQKSGKGGAVIATFVQRALAKLPLTIYGSGEQKREYMYVSDLVQAYDLVLKNKNLDGECINFGTGDVISILEIAEFIASELDSTIEFGDPRPGEVERFELNNNKGMNLGFKPQVSFWEGLTKYIGWCSRSHNQ